MYGRVYKPDLRDVFYDARLIYQDVNIRHKYWPVEPADDGPGIYSVGSAWRQLAYFQPDRLGNWTRPITTYDFFKAGKVGETDEEGSSIRGGARLLKKSGIIFGYYWTRDPIILANYILRYGPVIVGSAWYEGMEVPDRDTGVVSVGGDYKGEHAYLIDGVNLRTGLFRIKNSWGYSWGKEGSAYIYRPDLEKLMLDKTFEACMIIGNRRSRHWEVIPEKTTTTSWKRRE